MIFRFLIFLLSILSYWPIFAQGFITILDDSYQVAFTNTSDEDIFNQAFNFQVEVKNKSGNWTHAYVERSFCGQLIKPKTIIKSTSLIDTIELSNILGDFKTVGRFKCKIRGKDIFSEEFSISIDPLCMLNDCDYEIHLIKSNIRREIATKIKVPSAQAILVRVLFSCGKSEELINYCDTILRKDPSNLNANKYLLLECFRIANRLKSTNEDPLEINGLYSKIYTIWKSLPEEAKENIKHYNSVIENLVFMSQNELIEISTDMCEVNEDGVYCYNKTLNKKIKMIVKKDK